jgi:hypothetical protein
MYFRKIARLVKRDGNLNEFLNPLHEQRLQALSSFREDLHQPTCFGLIDRPTKRPEAPTRRRETPSALDNCRRPMKLTQFRILLSYGRRVGQIS